MGIAEGRCDELMLIMGLLHVLLHRSCVFSVRAFTISCRTRRKP